MPVDGPLKKQSSVKTRRYVCNQRHAGLPGSICQPVTEFTYNWKCRRPPPPLGPALDIRLLEPPTVGAPWRLTTDRRGCWCAMPGIWGADSVIVCSALSTAPPASDAAAPQKWSTARRLLLSHPTLRPNAVYDSTNPRRTPRPHAAAQGSGHENGHGLASTFSGQTCR